MLSCFLLIATGCASTSTNATAVTEKKQEAQYNPQTAVQVYVWTLDRRAKGIDFWDDLDNVLAEVKGSGAQRVEGFLNWFSTEAQAERVQGLLVKHDLQLVGAYANGVMHEEDEAEKAIDRICLYARLAKRCDLQFVDVNPMPLPDHKQKTDSELDTQARMLNKLGKRLADMGLDLVIHQHAPAIEHDAREHLHNLANTDPRWVNFCLDVDWVYRGGEDPLAMVKKMGSRIKAMHLRSSQDRVWMQTFGPGDVDYEAIADYLKKIDYQGWLVLELAYGQGTEVTRSVEENVRQSLKYMNAVFLK
jgi:sugar phosphate isomerase/epimerase